MAYVKPGQSNGSNSFRGGNNAPVATQAPRETDKSVIYSTGMFVPDKAGSKAAATVRTKEDITIPAGSYLNLYVNEATSEKSPKFRLQVRTAIKK